MSQRLRFRLLRLLCLFSLAAIPAVGLAQAHAPQGHDDPVTPIVLALAVILATAKLAGHFAVRIGQPAVLGELTAGVVRRAVGTSDSRRIRRAQ